MKYLEDDYRQDLSAKQVAIDRVIRQRLDADLDHAMHPPIVAVAESSPSRARNVLKLTHIRSRLGLTLDRLTSGSSADLKLFEHILRSARRRVESTGARFLFVYLPMWQRYGDPHMASPHREAVLGIVGKLDIPMVDMHGIFLDTGDPLSLFPFRLPAHYTPLGYRLVATEVVEVIRANQWLRNKNRPLCLSN